VKRAQIQTFSAVVVCIYTLETQWNWSYFNQQFVRCRYCFIL